MSNARRFFGLVLVTQCCLIIGASAHTVRYSTGGTWAFGVGSLALGIALLVIMVAVYIIEEAQSYLQDQS